MSTDDNRPAEPAPRPAPPTRAARQGRAMAIAVVGVALLGAGLFALRRPPPARRRPAAAARAREGAPAQRAEATAAELAFLDPIRVGTAIEGATVTRIGAVEEGLIHVDLRKGGEDLHFAIGLVHPGYGAPRAGRYAVYIWEREPRPDSSALADALARAMRPHADRPPPPGLTGGTFEAPPH